MIHFKNIRYKSGIITADGLCYAVPNNDVWRKTTINVKTGEFFVDGFSDYELEHSLLVEGEECNMFVRGVYRLIYDYDKNKKLPEKISYNWGR